MRSISISPTSLLSRGRSGVERELGPIDVLVTGAGVANAPPYGDAPPVWEERPEDWWRLFEVNVLGVYPCCRGLRGMIERGRGRIVNLAAQPAIWP